MADAKHEDHHFRFDHLIDNSVITDPDTHFSGTAFKLLAAEWAWIRGQCVDGAKNSLCSVAVDLAQCFECGSRIGYLVVHNRCLQPEFGHDICV